MKTTKFTSFDDYTKNTRKTSSWSVGGSYDVSVDFGFGSASTSNSFSHGQKSEENQMYKFFTETKGEAYVANAVCTHYSYTVKSYNRPLFDDAFINALTELNEAAKSSRSVTKLNAYRKFVEDYGTHYIEEADIGSDLTYRHVQHS